MVMGIDILPTFRAMAGMPPLTGVQLDGRDVTAVLTDGAPSPHEALVLFDNEDPIGIRTQQFKYLSAMYYRGFKLPFSLGGYEELYDLKADPSESYSVAASHPEVVKAMKTRLAQAETEFAPYKHKTIPPAFKAFRNFAEHLQD